MTYDYREEDEITSGITMYTARLMYWGCSCHLQYQLSISISISRLRRDKHGNGDVYSAIGRTDTLI